MGNFKRFLATCLALVMLVSLPTNAFAQSTSSDHVTINVISFNDFHGALIENGENDRNVGAAKAVTAALEAMERNPNTIIVSAGDNYNGTAISNLLYGEPVSAMLNLMNISASAIGNHEFDWGIDKIPAWSEAMGAPFVAANIYEKSSNQPAEWAIPYLIQEIDGVKVAFIGLTTPETAYKTAPENVNHLEFRNPVETAEEYVPIVKAEGADIVILLTHIGTYQDSETGDIRFEEGSEGLPFVPDVDAIITSHSHQTVVGKVNDVHIVQAWYNARIFAELEFVFDKTTSTLVSSDARLDELFTRKAELADNPEMVALLSDFQEKVGPILDEVIGVANEDFIRDRSTVSSIGQWTASLMRDAAGADIAVTNAGGLRVDLSAGEITVGNLYEFMPFDNLLSVFEMTGSQIKEIFEVGIENESIGTVQFSGAVVEFVSGAEPGSKVSSITLSDGTLVQPDDVYTVATNDFMGAGGDGFAIFLEANHISESTPLRDLMIEKIRSTGVLEHTLVEALVAVGTSASQPAAVEETFETFVQPDEQDIAHIVVLSVNDFHGALVETGPNDRNVGAAKLVTATKEALQKYPASVIVSAGDNYNGTALSNLLYGEPVSEMLNKMNITASAIGNHEFDWGVDLIPQWAEAMDAPFVSANIYDKATNQPVSWAKPYIIEEIDGVKVAFIGLTTPETAYKTKPENVNHLEFRDPAQTAEHFVPIVRAEGAEIVILLTHIGTYQDAETQVVRFEEGSERLPYVDGVDAIITSHSHQTVAGHVNGVPVIQAFYNGRIIAELHFMFDKDSRTLLSTEVALDKLFERKAELADDPEMAAIVASFQESVGPMLNEVIGTATQDFIRDRSTVSAIGQWTANLMREAGNADLAVTNAGGLRSDIMAGEVTVGHFYEFMPFDNVLSRFEMTGSQIKEIFEVGLENESIGTVQFSGAVVDFVPGADQGSKVSKITLSDGTVVQPNETYTVSTNDFMATGGDGFVIFLEANHLGDSVALRDLMIEKVRETGLLQHELTTALVAVEAVEVVEAVAPSATPTVEEVLVVEEEVIVSNSTTTHRAEYVVKLHDVLWRIAESFGLSWRTVSEYNSLRNPNLIFPGQVILIPN